MMTRAMVLVLAWVLMTALSSAGQGKGEAAILSGSGLAPNTVLLKDGRVVRLPALDRVNPDAVAAFAGQAVTLYPAAQSENRYHQILARIVFADGSDLAEKLVGAGQALVMPIYETRADIFAPLMAAERLARENHIGLWAGKVIVCADNAAQAFDHFAIIEGRIVTAAKVKGTLYLNFGADYRKDFTIKISSKVLKTLGPEFQQLTETPNPDRLIEVRGYVFFSGGPMIDVKIPSQVSFVESETHAKGETCS